MPLGRAKHAPDPVLAQRVGETQRRVICARCLMPSLSCECLSMLLKPTSPNTAPNPFNVSVTVIFDFAR